MKNLTFVLEVTFNSDSDFETVKSDAKMCSIKEWAEEKGYEFFFVKRGIAFKGVHMPPASYKVSSWGELTITLDGEDWDLMVNFYQVALRLM